MERVLRQMTDRPWCGFVTGTVVTAVVQSSAAVGVVTAELAQSGILTLRRTIPILIGANVGTTVTAWLLCAAQGIPYGSLLSTVLAVIGGVCCLMPTYRHWGRIFWGVFFLLSGMETVTAAARPLTESVWLGNLFTAAEHPLVGLTVGMMLAVLLQSSSVSVGLLQALSVSGQISYAVAIPMVLGQNIGTCLTVFLAALGGKRRAGQTAWAHLLFNVISAGITLLLWQMGKPLFFSSLARRPIGFMGIAAIHTVFNLMGTAVFLPQCERFAALIEGLTARPRSVSANR